MQHIICPICASDALNEVFVGSTPMLTCSNCTVTLTPPSVLQPTSYYEQDYSLTTTTRTSTELHRYFRYPEYQDLVALVHAYQEPPAKLLDIGCDHGFFLDDVRRHGYEVTGVEPSERGRVYAQKIGLQVHESLSDVRDRYHVVTLWHVLEHIPDPVGMLTALKQQLEPGAFVFVRVPDFGSIASRLLRQRWIWFQPHHHAVHYTTRSLRRMFNEAGYSVQSIEQRRPNTRHTRRSYRLSTSVMNYSHNLPMPSLRDRAARLYQDVTGVELLAIVKYEGKE